MILDQTQSITAAGLGGLASSMKARSGMEPTPKPPSARA
jgi:hypothetical protein